jgi:hypothetical protein
MHEHHLVPELNQGQTPAPAPAGLLEHPLGATLPDAGWGCIEARLEAMQGGRGLGIDPGIRETVGGLWAHGVRTTSSCEGHGAWGCAMPWVDIGCEAPPGAPWNMSPSEREAWRRTTLRSVITVSELLSGFYADRQVSWHRSLTLKPLGRFGAARLESMGPNETLSERAGAGPDPALIQANRAEMGAFGAWVHERALQEGAGG